MPLISGFSKQYEDNINQSGTQPSYIEHNSFELKFVNDSAVLVAAIRTSCDMFSTQNPQCGRAKFNLTTFDLTNA